MVIRNSFNEIQTKEIYEIKSHLRGDLASSIPPHISMKIERRSANEDETKIHSFIRFSTHWHTFVCASMIMIIL